MPDAPTSAFSENTLRAWRADWNHFAQWCKDRRLRALPAEAETVRLYVAAIAVTHKFSSIERRVRVITRRQCEYGEWAPAARPSPAVRSLIRSIRRDQGSRPTAKRPLTVEELRKIVSRVPAICLPWETACAWG